MRRRFKLRMHCGEKPKPETETKAEQRQLSVNRLAALPAWRQDLSLVFHKMQREVKALLDHRNCREFFSCKANLWKEVGNPQQKRYLPKLLGSS